MLEFGRVDGLSPLGDPPDQALPDLDCQILMKMIAERVGGSKLQVPVGFQWQEQGRRIGVGDVAHQFYEAEEILVESHRGRGGYALIIIIVLERKHNFKTPATYCFSN